MKDSLITFFCGKNSTKRRKVLRILDGISYNSESKEYTCPSSTNPDKKYVVIYSTKAFEWKCECEASTWYQYQTYESVEQRNSYRNQKRCIHIIASMIQEFLRCRD